jgi:hypothetical protein
VRFQLYNALTQIKIIMSKKWRYFFALFVSLFMVTPFTVCTYANEPVQSVSQTKKITGTVVDKDGEPVIGANVSVKGTKKGVITNQNGKFTINTRVRDKELIKYFQLLRFIKLYR